MHGYFCMIDQGIALFSFSLVNFFLDARLPKCPFTWCSFSMFRNPSFHIHTVDVDAKNDKMKQLF